MNRSRRPPANKPFVSGGIYDANRQSFGGGGGHQQRGGPRNYNNNQQQEQQDFSNQENQQQTAPAQVQQNTVRGGKFNVAQQRIQKQQVAPPLEPPPQPPVMEDEPQMEDDKVDEDDNNKIDDLNLFDESGKLQYKNIFRTRKKSSVRAKEKKIRQNRQLRKTLIPKNALMALNEVAGISISEFTINNSSSGGFVANVSVNDKQYEGKGQSKIAAKNNASEKALRDYVLEKMREKPRFRKNSVNNEETEETNDTNNAISENGEDMQQDGPNATTIIDDVPMVNLASFAIYKLFTEWENEGYVVPELRITHPPHAGSADEGSTQPKTPKAPPIRSELPNNWESIHPSTLLCMMRPGLQYRELGTTGEQPNVLQRMAVTVNDVDYECSGRSKKIARRNVAVSVLNELFGTNFTLDEPTEA